MIRYIFAALLLAGTGYFILDFYKEQSSAASYGREALALSGIKNSSTMRESPEETSARVRSLFVVVVAVMPAIMPDGSGGRKPSTKAVSPPHPAGRHIASWRWGR